MNVVARGTLVAALLLAAGCSTGYRTEEESKELRAAIDDRTIESHIRVAFAADPTTRAVPIEIACVAGTVHLSGTVAPDSTAAARAKALALGVEGVRRVVVRFRDDDPVGGRQ